ncbi:MAG TPA: hypothetical protein VIL00_16080 [Pseudonocardiaceae bacterium]
MSTATTQPPVPHAPTADTQKSSLVRLAEAAARTAGGDGGAVAVVRGFDRNSRQRASLLRGHLTALQVQVIDATPALTRSESAIDRLPRLSAVINAAGAASDDAHRLAARLRVPLLTLADGETASEENSGQEVAERRRDVIEINAPDRARDVAFVDIAAEPVDEQAGELTVTVDGESGGTLTGSSVLVTLVRNQLGVRVSAPGRAPESLFGQRVVLQATSGAYTLIRDGLPIGELGGPLTLTVEPQDLAVHFVQR